jgi:hypothetical protein
MRRFIAASLVVFFMLASLTEAGGLNSKKAMYVGGTVAALKERTEGVPSTTDEKVFVFTYKEGGKESKLTVPYDRINDLRIRSEGRQAAGIGAYGFTLAAPVEEAEALSHDWLPRRKR